MLRIEPVLDGNKTVLRIAGRLTGPWVAELSRAVAEQPDGAVLVLDLTEVSFADHDGLAFLLSLIDEQRVVLRCSHFLTEQLSTTSRVSQ